METRAYRTPIPVRAFVRRCKQRRFRSKVVDTTGARLSGGNLLARTLVLRRLLLRHVLDADEEYVGILLPPSLGGVVTNTAVSLAKRIAVNLNYTLAEEVMNSCIAQCGIKVVLTSRRVVEQMGVELDAEMVYLEDLGHSVTWVDKLVSAFQAYVSPAWILERHLGLHTIAFDDVLAVIFTSGSTGTPKGAMLTQTNIASNVQAADDVIQLNSDDVLVGVLPFFHSFGYTLSMWTVMMLDIGGAYHFNPLQSRQVGKLCEMSGGTILLATPSFLRAYLRRCTRANFATLEAILVGAERLPRQLTGAFEEKFGVRPVEGYGCTETSPLVSSNIPPSRSKSDLDLKEGTVGRPVPGVRAKVTALASSEELGPSQQGMLWVKGPNVMKGYLGREDKTAEVIQNGWYRTGDVVLLDEDGFITIVGRESRFAKIMGEMVPLDGIETALNQIIGVGEDEGQKASVTAVPDEKTGERLVVVHTPTEQTPEDLRQALLDEGLSYIYVPPVDSFLQVDDLPMLGTGKLDHKSIRQMAEAILFPAK